ncbi:hypothetical protein HOY80DRAFT_750910 [Tuber brumale]|nr:hypothetical protein HOY80DRAFT_750910 [Tuber brumale]
MERNYTAAVRAINADSRKRHRSQLEVVIPCPPPKTDKNSEDFISLNFESENGDEEDDCDGDDNDEGDGYDNKGGSGGYSPSEDLKTTQASMSEEDKGNGSEGGISEKTRSKRRRKDLSGRKDNAIGEREVGEEAMKAVAKGEELLTATQGIGRRAPAVAIEIKSSSSPSGGAYQHEDEDKDSATRKAQQQRQQQELISTVVSPPPYLAITTTSPLSLPASTLTNVTDANTNATFSSSNLKSQLVAKKTTVEILQGNKDLPQKALRKLAKNQKRRERRRVGQAQWKASLEQQRKASVGRPRGASFGSVSSDVSEVGEEEEAGEGQTNESGDEGLEINLAQEEEGQVEAKEEEDEENYISLSVTKTPEFTTSRRGVLPLNSSGLSSSPSPSPIPVPALGSSSGGSGGQDGHRRPPIPIDRETVVFQLRYHATSTPPPFIHEESRPLFTSTKGITAASFRLDAKRFEELEDPSRGITMEAIICDVCLGVGHARRTCRLLKCEHCDAWDKHFSNACPELPVSEVSLGNYDWRKLPQTAPPPSPPTATTAARASPTPFRPINANCYHCSGTEHFGDDCPFLPPLSYPGIFSLSGVNDGDYASQEWLCEKRDLLAELEDKAKRPVYGRAVRPGDYDVSEEFDPFGEYRALERGKDRDKRRDTSGGGKMMMGRRRAGERSPSPPHRRGHPEFDRYRDRDRDRNWERGRGRDWRDRRSESPPVRRATGVYYSSSTASGPNARYRDRGVDYSRVPPPPSIPPPRVQSPPPPPPQPQPPTSVRHPIPLRPPVTLNQARRGSAGRGCNTGSTGIGRGGGGRGLPLSSRKRGGGGGRGPK